MPLCTLHGSLSEASEVRRMLWGDPLGRAKLRYHGACVSAGFPQQAMKHRSAVRKVSVVMSDTTLSWTAFTVRE